MLKHTIGENAGTIWQLLNKESMLSIKSVQKRTCLTTKDLYLAFGWLARENKLYFFDRSNELYVCLIYD